MFENRVKKLLSASQAAWGASLPDASDLLAKLTVNTGVDFLWVDLEHRSYEADAVRWIREAGGVPVLAHPTWVRTSAEGLRVLVRKLKADGLGGIEVHYSTHTPSQTTEYLDLAKQCDLLVTGGSDFHGVTKPDIEVGIGRGQLKVSQKLLDPLRKAATVS